MTGEYPKCSQCGTYHDPEPGHCHNVLATSPTHASIGDELNEDGSAFHDGYFTVEEDERIGTVIDDDFTITGVLGKGGFATVYEAQQHAMDNRIVALKMLQPKHANDPTVARRFHEEVKTVSKLEPHENIVTVFASGKTPDGGLYLAMERLRGETLKDILKAGGAIPVKRASAIATDICNALTVLHSHGIIHRDIKPANIMIIEGRGSQPDRSKLLDFGIARSIHPESESLTQEGQIIGTLRYMSPEQCLGRNEITTASDIYSLGVVLFEMLTGVRPYAGNSQSVGIQHATPTITPPPFHDVNSAVSVPEEVELFTRRALGKKAEGRPATADGFAKQLREALDAGYGEHPLGSTSAERPSPESSGKVSRRLVATFVILCALIAVVALAGWYFLDQRASSFQKDTELALEDTDLKVCTTPFLNIGKKADEVLSDFREVLQKPALRSEQKRFHKLGELLEKGIEQWGFRGNEHCQQKQRTEEQDDDMLDRQQRATFLLVKLGNSFLRITSDRLPTEANILEDQAHAVVECSLSSYLCSPLLVASRGSAAPNSRIEVSAQLACRRPTKDGGHETLTQCLERTHRPTDEFQLHLERSPDTAVYVFLSDTDGHFNAKRISGRDGPIDSPWMSFGERTNGDALRIQVVASVETPEWLENLRGESFDPVQGKLGPEAQTLRGQLTMAQLDAKTDMSDTPDVDDSITGTGTGLAVVDIALERETAASP